MLELWPNAPLLDDPPEENPPPPPVRNDDGAGGALAVTSLTKGDGLNIPPW